MADQPDETTEREPVEADVEPTHGTSNFLAVREAVDAQMKKGANWFFWIAGLSVVNSVILLMEGDRHFVVGLGVTQLVNAIALEAD